MLFGTANAEETTLLRLSEAISAKKTDAAVTLLRELTQQKDLDRLVPQMNSVVRVPLWYRLGQEAQALSLNPAGKKRIDEVLGADSKVCWQEFVEFRNKKSLERLVRRYPSTEHYPAAVAYLGEIALRDGDPAAARFWWELLPASEGKAARVKLARAADKEMTRTASLPNLQCECRLAGKKVLCKASEKGITAENPADNTPFFADSLLFRGSVTSIAAYQGRLFALVKGERIVALNLAAEGRLDWAFQTEFGEEIVGAPIANHLGVFLLVLRRERETATLELLRLGDRTGKVVWRMPVDQGALATGTLPAVSLLFSGLTLYVASPITEQLAAVDATTGALRWSRKIDKMLGNLLYSDGILTYSPEKKQSWDAATGEPLKK